MVKDDLPKELTLYPGDKDGPYTIEVTNNGKITYNATLYYSITANQSVKYEITPASGASQEVKPEETVRFEIYIIILKESAPGIAESLRISIGIATPIVIEASGRDFIAYYNVNVKPPNPLLPAALMGKVRKLMGAPKTKKGEMKKWHYIKSTDTADLVQKLKELIDVILQNQSS